MSTENIKTGIQILICLGIWILVFQGFNTSTSKEPQRVRVINTVDIDGEVDVNNINGTLPVNVGNTIDINIARINGRSDVFYQDNDGSYMVLPVSIRH